MAFLKSRWAWATSIAVVVTLTVVSGAMAAVTTTTVSPQPVAKAAPVEDSLLPELPARRSAIVPAAVVATSRSKARVTVPLLPSADGIPAVALTAYRHAAQLENAADPACRLPWQLVAAIGYIESDHGQIGGDSVDAQGDEASPIQGLALDGTNGVARMVDRRGHVVRAEGPLQFVPSTWAAWKVDANGDGHADPQNIFDASAAAAGYLCSGGLDLSSVDAQAPAIASYNDSPIYVKNVQNVERAYLAGRSADTVTLIPMQTCPAPASKPGAPPSIAPSPGAATAATPAGCPKTPVKKSHKHAKARHVAPARQRTAPAPSAPAQPALKPTPSSTPTQPAMTSPSPSATSTASQPTATPTP